MNIEDYPGCPYDSLAIDNFDNFYDEFCGTDAIPFIEIRGPILVSFVSDEGVGIDDNDFETRF